MKYLVLIVALATMAAPAMAQPRYMSCSNGTQVITIQLPGMCPTGYWPT